MVYTTNSGLMPISIMNFIWSQNTSDVVTLILFSQGARRFMLITLITFKNVNNFLLLMKIQVFLKLCYFQHQR